MTERQFQGGVEQLLRLYGWRYYHTHDSRRSSAGFPDLCAVRGSRLVFIELKTETGRVSDEQKAWLADLENAGVEAYVWRPSDMERIPGILALRDSASTWTGSAR